MDPPDAIGPDRSRLRRSGRHPQGPRSRPGRDLRPSAPGTCPASSCPAPEADSAHRALFSQGVDRRLTALLGIFDPASQVVTAGGGHADNLDWLTERLALTLPHPQESLRPSSRSEITLWPGRAVAAGELPDLGDGQSTKRRLLRTSTEEHQRDPSDVNASAWAGSPQPGTSQLGSESLPREGGLCARWLTVP